MPDLVSRSDAKAAGLRRYFTGKPCRHGHVSERYIWGACIECYRLHDAKPCRKKAHRASDKEWKKNNPEKVAAKNRKSYVANKAARLEAARLYRENNAEKVARCNLEWRAKNAEHMRAYHRKYLEENRERFSIKNRLRVARVRASGGRATKSDIDRLMEAQKGKCPYCKVSIRLGFEIDHIIPVTKGGTSWPENLQLTCPSCNSRKGNKMPEEFARSIGLLI